MKVTFETQTKYPFVGKLVGYEDRETILVLFYDEQKGVVLVSDQGYYKVGEYSKTWDMEQFEPFRGKITIDV